MNIQDYPECPFCGNDDLIYYNDGTVECPVCGETWNVENEN